MSGSTAAITSIDVNFAQRLAGILRGQWRGRSAIKRAARDIGVSDRTLEGWWQARREPRARDLIAAMAACDALRAEVDALVAERKALLGK